MKNKILTLAALLTFPLTSCGGNSELKIIAPTGAPSLCFYKEATNTNFETNATPKNILAFMTESSPYDLVCVDAMSGISAIKNGAPFKLASILTNGNFYLVATGNDEDVTLSTDDKIILFNRNAAPDIMFHYIYGNDYDANIQYVTAAKDTVAVLKTGKYNNEDIDYVFMAEPSIYTARQDTSAATYETAYVYANIQTEYKNKTGGKSPIQAGLFINSKSDKNTVNSYLNSLKTSVNDGVANPTLIKDELGKLTPEVCANKFSVSAANAEAITRDNNKMGLCYLNAYENKEVIDTYLTVSGKEVTSEEIYYK